MEVGTKIKKVRELKNLTQEYMAEKLSVNQSTYSRIEKNEGDISILTLEKISDVLQMRLEDLLSFDEKYVFINNASNPSANHANVINQYISENERKLYEDKIKLLEDKIELLNDKIKKAGI